MMEQLWFVPLGFAAGVIGSIIGLGGGFVVVPVLTFFGFSPSLAASNSLFGVLGNAAAASLSYSRQGRVQYRLGILLGLLCVPGTVLGAILSSEVMPDTFKALFAMVLVGSAAYILLRKRIKTGEHNVSARLMIFAAAASFFAGTISSLFGIGGGVIFVPLMVAGMGMAMKRAAPTSQMILLFASVSGVIAHSMLGHPDFVQAGALMLGSFLGGLVGARLMPEIKERWLQAMASVAVLAVAAKLLLDSVPMQFQFQD